MDQAAKLFSAQNLDGVNAHLKIPCLVAGMAAVADSIDDMGLLRRVPSTFGSRLPSMRG